MKAFKLFLTSNVILFIFIFPNNYIKAQVIHQSFNRPIAALNIGDLVPDVELQRIINYKNSKAKLSDFQGKVIILDFFATWCKGCVSAIPKLSEFQRTEAANVQFLVVSAEPESKVSDFIKKFPNKLAYITSDSLLRKMFPHRLIPHEVWIGPDGRVAAITSADYITKENIDKIAKGATAIWPVKKDNITRNNQEPLLLSGSKPLYYSSILPYQSGLGSGISGDSLPSSTFTRLTNLPVIKMYTIVWGHALGWPENRVSLEVKDRSRFIYDSSLGYRDEWRKRNSYCYESVLPEQLTREQRSQCHRNDLDRFFGLNGRMENRKVPCWLLIIAPGSQVKASTNTVYMEAFSSLDSIKKLHRAPLSSLVFHLNKKSIIPIVDETGFAGNVDIEMKVKFTDDMEYINQSLLPYGLQLIRGERQMEMMVITEL